MDISMELHYEKNSQDPVKTPWLSSLAKICWQSVIYCQTILLYVCSRGLRECAKPEGGITQHRVELFLHSSRSVPASSCRSTWSRSCALLRCPSCSSSTPEGSPSTTSAAAACSGRATSRPASARRATGTIARERGSLCGGEDQFTYV